MIAAQPSIRFRDCILNWREDWLHALSVVERARADRFRCDADRRRFVAARHLLRTTLAPRLGLDPAALPITIDATGKPRVVGAPDFSISHAGDHVAIAIAPSSGIAVGVDIDQMRDDLDHVALARHVFAVEERALLDGAPDRTTAFFRLWTLKEAILKAAGQGLMADPRTLCVDITGGAAVVVRAPAALRPDHCRTIAAPPGYAAAIAWRR